MGTSIVFQSTAALPDIRTCCFLTNSVNEDLNYTKLETEVQLYWHTQTCAHNGHYHFISKYGPIPFSTRDSY
jgi:hypothetical protein